MGSVSRFKLALYVHSTFLLQVYILSPPFLVQAAELDAQLQALGAEKADVANALENLQAEHAAAGEAASQAAAAAAQALSQTEAQRAALEEQVASLSAAALEHAKYQQELEGTVSKHIIVTLLWGLSLQLYLQEADQTLRCRLARDSRALKIF